MLDKKGFTLAELLVTLGIIGVVAAMTLPTLIGAVEERILESKTKNAMSKISQAATTYMANNGLYSLSSLYDCYEGNSKKYCTNEKIPTIQKMIETTMKISQKCEKAQDCFPETFMDETGKNYNIDEIIDDEGSTTYKFLDNYTINITLNNEDVTVDGLDIFGQFRILTWLDVNGKSSPNVVGEDIWFFDIDEVGNIKTPVDDYSTECKNLTNKSINKLAECATQKFIENKLNISQNNRN